MSASWKSATIKVHSSSFYPTCSLGSRAWLWMTFYVKSPQRRKHIECFIHLKSFISKQNPEKCASMLILKNLWLINNYMIRGVQHVKMKPCSLVNCMYFCSQPKSDLNVQCQRTKTVFEDVSRFSLRLRCYDTLWLTMTLPCAVWSFVLIWYTLFYHLIPLAWRHILYTFTSSLCACWSDAIPVRREPNTLLFFFFFFFWVKFDCDGYILYVCLLSPLITPLFGVFVQSILLSKNIISIIVCCMFDV